MLVKTKQKAIIKSKLEQYVYCIESSYLDLITNYLENNTLKIVKSNNMDLFEIFIEDIKYAKIVKNWLISYGIPVIPLETDNRLLRIHITEFYHRFT